MDKEKIVAEISPEKLVLKCGEKEFEVPRDRYKSVYDAMVKSVQLRPDEKYTVEIVPKDMSKPHIGTRAWVMDLIPW